MLGVLGNFLGTGKCESGCKVSISSAQHSVLEPHKCMLKQITGVEGSIGPKGVWESAGAWVQVGTHCFHRGWYPVYKVPVLSLAPLQRALPFSGSSE